MWLPLALVPFVVLLVAVPLALGILGFRARYNCDACTADHFWCSRKDAGRSCPFFE